MATKKATPKATAPKHTKYEKARIIGARATQISQGAPLYREMNDDELKALHYDPIAIALIEYDEGLIPIGIKKPLPEKRTETEIIED